MQDSKLDEFARLISAWPGLMAKPDRALIHDSLVLLEHLGAARTLVDIGSGAGLPGIALKIARPVLHVTLVESDQAKAAFLVHAGRLLAQKTTDEDPAAAAHAIDVLGGKLSGVKTAPSAARAAGTVVVIDKVRPGPAQYPRRPGVPARKPLS